MFIMYQWCLVIERNCQQISLWPGLRIKLWLLMVVECLACAEGIQGSRTSICCSSWVLLAGAGLSWFQGSVVLLLSYLPLIGDVHCGLQRGSSQLVLAKCCVDSWCCVAATALSTC